MESFNEELINENEYDDEDGEDICQFHCGNGDYAESQIQLVKLSTIIGLDPMIHEIADLPVGYCAKRESVSKQWIYEQE